MRRSACALPTRFESCPPVNLAPGQVGCSRTAGAEADLRLRGFGLCPVEISKQEPWKKSSIRSEHHKPLQESKSAISFLKAAYRDKAKARSCTRFRKVGVEDDLVVWTQEQHPDLAPHDEQAEAEKKFVKLSTEFNEASALEGFILPEHSSCASEALKLLEAGAVASVWLKQFSTHPWSEKKVQPVERARVVDLNPGKIVGRAGATATCSLASFVLSGAHTGAAHVSWHPHFQSYHPERAGGTGQAACTVHGSSLLPQVC